MWSVLLELLNRDKAVLISILVIYLLLSFAAPYLVLPFSIIFVLACLVTLTRRVWPVVKISLGASLLLLWVVAISAGWATVSVRDPIDQIFIFLSLFFGGMIFIIIFQLFLSFFILVSSFQNVGFFRACWYSVRYHWDKFLVFLLMLYPLYLLIYDVFFTEGIGQIAGHWSWLKLLGLVVWCTMLVPYISAAWLLADPNLAVQAKASAAAASVLSQDVAADEAESSGVVIASQQPLPDEEQTAILQEKTSFWTVFIELLKADSKMLIAAFISFVVLSALIPQMIILFLPVFYGIFLAILTKRRWCGVVCALLGFIGLHAFVLFITHVESQTLFDLIFVMFFELPFIVVSSCSLFLSGLICLIGSFQRVGFFKACGRALRYHFGKSSFCIFIAWLIPIECFALLLPHLGIVGAACFSPLLLLWFGVFIPYLLAAWLKVRPNLPKRTPAPKPVQAPASVYVSPSLVSVSKLAAQAARQAEEKAQEENKKRLEQNKKQLFQLLLARDANQLRQLLQSFPNLARETWADTGNTPLHVAALNGWREEMYILLEVDPSACHITNRAGKRPVDLAKEKGYDNLAVYLEPSQEK